MLVGILGDTHDRVEAARAAVGVLQGRGAEFFIHCGDVGGEQILDLFAGLKVAIVWGNNDYDRVELAAYGERLGLGMYGEMASLELEGKKIAVTHGDDFRLMRRIETGQQYDYLFHGHTHVRRDERVGRLRIINPGALHRAARKTVALLNLSSDGLEYFDILRRDRSFAGSDGRATMAEQMEQPVNQWKIRSFGKDDLPCCRSLYSDGLIGGKIAENDTGLDIDDIESAYMNTPGNHFWVAESDQGKVIGMIGVQHYDEGTGEIRRLRVAQDHRRRGIGSALVETALKFCQDHQYLKITLDTFMEREPAIKLFQKFRFRHDKSRSVNGKELMYFYLDLYTGMPRRHKEDDGFVEPGGAGK